ncbi:hypothetical protein [Amycolatopsis anabasis]|uniref:hypothetical protein n=1 Tax=Amycolatopsis anabasis TaxID=1840409 RepID=UPI00131BBC29|nr:hypothetical protein [Amycolatopsis anabasis]
MIAVLVIFGIAATSVSLAVVLGLRSVRERQADQHNSGVAIGLRYGNFNGQPFVYANPLLWPLPPHDIQRMAVEQGYAEVQSPYPGLLLFQCVQPAIGLRQQPRAVYFPRQLFDIPDNTLDAKREQWLLNRINSGDQIWVSLREARLSRRTIEAIVTRHDRRISWMLGDETDQMLLVGKGTAPSHGLTTPRTGLRQIRPTVWQWIAMGVFGLASLGAAITYQILQHGLEAAFCYGCATLFPVLFASSIRLYPRSRRFELLTQEFNGPQFVKVRFFTYGISRSLMIQAADAYGYATRDELVEQGQTTGLTFVRKAS